MDEFSEKNSEKWGGGVISFLNIFIADFVPIQPELFVMNIMNIFAMHFPEISNDSPNG